VKLLGFNVGGQTFYLTEEQGRWLAAELRMHRPLDTLGPAVNAAVIIELAMEDADPRGLDAENRPDEARAMLEVLSDRPDLAPKPKVRLLTLRRALRAELKG
jgi:hypothetical protein